MSRSFKALVAGLVAFSAVAFVAAADSPARDVYRFRNGDWQIQNGHELVAVEDCLVWRNENGADVRRFPVAGEGPESCVETVPTTTVPSTTTSVPPTTVPPSTVPPTTAPPTTAPPTTSIPPTTTEPPANPATYVYTFDTPADFYDEWDRGFSGFDPATNRNSDRQAIWLGDHDEDCGGPGTQRTINVDRDVPSEAIFGGSVADFDDIWYHCRGHVMTALITVGYSIAWMTPKQTFTDVSRVCFDMNLTTMSSRQWQQLVFVPVDLADDYPSGGVGRAGTNGFDLGYTNPGQRNNPGPNAGFNPPPDSDLAGLAIFQAGFLQYFEGDTWTTTGYNGSFGLYGVADKAGRYQHCVEDLDDGTVRITQEQPGTAVQNIVVPGSIPSGEIFVVLQDDNYNTTKGDRFDPNAITVHWDNVIIEEG